MLGWNANHLTSKFSYVSQQLRRNEGIIKMDLLLLHWDETKSLWIWLLTAPTVCPAYATRVKSVSSGTIWTGESARTRKKTRSSATLSTASPTLTDLDANRGLRDENPVTDSLSCGMAKIDLQKE
jgi:hypothetical protein